MQIMQIILYVRNVNSKNAWFEIILFNTIKVFCRFPRSNEAFEIKKKIFFKHSVIFIK